MPETEADLLRYLARTVEDLRELVTDRLEEIGKRIDHGDTVAHGTQQVVIETAERVRTVTATLEKYQPVIERWADPGASVRDLLFPGGRKRGEKKHP